jgi:hypothetical protein
LQNFKKYKKPCSIIVDDNIMIDTYDRHRFARSLSRSRSKVKVICVSVARLEKKSYKKPCSIIMSRPSPNAKVKVTNSTH